MFLCAFFCAFSEAWTDETAGRDGTDVEKLRSEIQAVRPGSPFQSGPYEELCKRVYASKNAELLALSWEKSAMQADLRQLVFQDVDTSFRNQFVLILLRASTSAWHEEFMHDYPRLAEDEYYRLPRGMLYGICSSFLKHYLPAQTLEKYPIDKRENRLILASLFEKALGEKAAKNQAREPISPGASLSPGPPLPVAAATSVARQPPVWPWLAGIAALAAITLLVWKRNHN